MPLKVLLTLSDILYTDKGYNINVKKYTQNIQGLWNSPVLGNGFLSICDVGKAATIHKLI
jgi:hypothetical protein